MSTEVAESSASTQKRYFTMDEVLAQIRAVGIEIDVPTVIHHLYRTRKMPKPVKGLSGNDIGPLSRSNHS